MRIEDIRKEIHGERCRVCARIVWEKNSLPDFEMFFETSANFSDDLTLNPNAFVIASILPAMALGEDRVLVDGWVCPELKENLMVATGLLREWYGPPRVFITLESTQEFQPFASNKQPRAASFLSGGIDSLATLRTNQLNYPQDHPRYIKDCLILYGFDMGFNDFNGEEDPVFERTIEHLSGVLKETNVTLIPLYTNARFLHKHRTNFFNEYHAAILAAAAHVFTKRLTSISISSSGSFDTITTPWGSHPFLDPNFSSTNLQVFHTGFQYSRLEKVNIVSQWPVGLAGVKVCVRNSASQINCGECHKCIRTMLELYVMNHLHEAPSFPCNDVSEDLVRKLRPGILHGYTGCYYTELYPALKKMGRNDIIRVLKRRRRQHDFMYPFIERWGLEKIIQDPDNRFVVSLKKLILKWLL